jgi:hypothetical protein
MIDQQLSTTVNINVILKYPFLLLMLITSFSQSFSQQSVLSQEQIADSSLAKAIRIYDNTIGRNSFLYTGRVYVDKYQGIRGHQYFGEDYWEQGEITYEGQKFDSIFLMYDIYNDQVILEHFNSGGAISPIKLYNPKINSFNLQGHHFIRLQEDTVFGLKEGFYDELFDGEKTTVYVMREKQISKANQTNDLHEIFIEKHKYYIKKDDQYFRIRGRKDIAKVMKDHKREIKRYLRRNILSFRREPDRTILTAAQLYETL